MIRKLFYLILPVLTIYPSIVFSSEPKPWQLNLQEPAGIIAELSTDLHDFLLIVITLISLFVLGLLIYVCIRFRENKKSNDSKTSHNTIIEILWTVIPVIILVEL